MKIYGLSDWTLNDIETGTERFVAVEISIEYPGPSKLIALQPIERLKQVDKIYKENVDDLIGLNLFEKYSIIKCGKRATGINARMKYDDVHKLVEIPYLRMITIKSIDHAVKLEKEEAINLGRFFCVVMTVMIEVEGLCRKREDIEKRFVLVKALSSEDAYEKLEQQKSAYSVPYLNYKGLFVRWRIESFDDCYETYARSADDFNAEEGVEVYSKLGTRRSKSPTVWDGK